MPHKRGWNSSAHGDEAWRVTGFAMLETCHGDPVTAPAKPGAVPGSPVAAQALTLPAFSGNATLTVLLFRCDFMEPP